MNNNFRLVKFLSVCGGLNNAFGLNKTITIKGREAKGSGTLSVSPLSLFSLYQIRTRQGFQTWTIH